MSLPYFPMFPSDFEAKTSHLTLAEDGAYNRLLRICWMTPGCTIPTDESWIMRRVRAHTEADQEAVRTILSEYFTAEKGRYSNAKLMRIWREANEAHEKRKTAGAKGGKAKAMKTKDYTSSNAVAKPKQPEPEPEPYIRKSSDTNVSQGISDETPRPANDLSQAVSRYNDAAQKAGWPQVQKLTPNRSKQLRQRLKECDGMEGWEHALRKAFASDFCRGRTANPWQGFGFDWLVKPSNFTKLMEGNYDNRANNGAKAGPNGKPSNSLASIVARRELERRQGS